VKIIAARVKNGMPVGPYLIKDGAELVRMPEGTDPIAYRQSRAIMALGADHSATPIAEPRGLAGKIVRAIDRADAQGRGCGGCRAVRKVARKMVTKLARPRQ
jgi:hypothetical protein